MFDSLIGFLFLVVIALGFISLMGFVFRNLAGILFATIIIFIWLISLAAPTH